MHQTTTTIIALTLILTASGCMHYWGEVEKQQEENFLLADELKWQGREEERKAKEAQEATAPVPNKPLKPSEF